MRQSDHARLALPPPLLFLAFLLLSLGLNLLFPIPVASPS